MAAQVEAAEAAAPPPLALQEGEELLRSWGSVTLARRDRETGRPGFLYVTSKRLVFVLEEAAARALDVPFARVTLHAVTRDETAFQKPCLYCQFDGAATGEGDDGAG
eukprot:CAMPEP_0118860678 /NCGR_PEP_ID=MMETSP1163-20130328/6449_1 /TAXON_ID=124430 /ORGANISM="Phaeomonas parva, Strain CCMP2877" /LENGTH=106 /DNA_ID=CAMNT_0006794399 /DNA_START=148 /DNA_END=465 /DNA_ORIENTATION=+